MQRLTKKSVSGCTSVVGICSVGTNRIEGSERLRRIIIQGWVFIIQYQAFEAESPSIKCSKGNGSKAGSVSGAQNTRSGSMRTKSVVAKRQHFLQRQTRLLSVSPTRSVCESFVVRLLIAVIRKHSQSRRPHSDSLGPSRTVDKRTNSLMPPQAHSSLPPSTGESN